MSETVIVSEREYAKAEQSFRLSSAVNFKPASVDEDALAAAVLSERARAVVVGAKPYTSALYQALRETSGGQKALIMRFGVGYDGIDTKLAHDNGILVCNTPGTLDASVAEHTVWLMGALARHIPRLDAALRLGEFTSLIGQELRGLRLGVIGYGRIGRRVAEMAHFGFGMEVWGAGILDLKIETLPELKLYTTDLDRVLRECDYLSLHLPSAPETHHFINSARLQLFKPTARLINTARGNLVDEAALYDALASHQLAGAALDVFENEPYRPTVPGKDLRQLANVVLTPHVASNTVEANQRMVKACLENITNFFAGRFEQLTQVGQSLTG